MNTLQMALRVSTSGDGRGSTPAIKVAVAAVALSVAVMLAAIAIVLGFKEEITRKVIGFNPHIVLKVNPALSGEEYLAVLSPQLQEILDGMPFIESYALSASAPAIFKTPTDFKGIYLRSASNDLSGDFLKSQLTEGSFPDFENSPNDIIISRMAADQLMVGAGDTLSTFFITDRVRVEPLRVAGVYNSHFSSYDDIFAFGSLPLIQKVGEIRKDEGTSVNIYVDDFNKIPEYTAELRQELDRAYALGSLNRYYEIDTTLSTGANFFSWLSLLDTNVVVILVLMTAVALITLISGMMILIVDKKRFVSIMKALGAPNRMVRKIFVWLTVRVAFTGLIIGNIIILIILWLQDIYHFIPLDADSYYIDFVPVRITLGAVIILNAGIILVTYLALLLPTRAMIRN